MKNNPYIIITAGGTGVRMGGDIAKQFLSINNKPILLRTLELFTNWNPNANIIVVLPSQYKEYWKEYCVSNNIWIKHTIVSGGITRFHSVKNALNLVPDNSLVAVHDGVRPFAPKTLLDDLFNYEFSLEKKICGVIPAMDMIESIREKVLDSNGFTIKTNTADRSKYISIQTPQLFLSTQLKEAYNVAYAPSFTDDASVMESFGYNIDTIKGSKLNIKITTPEDIIMGEAILKVID